MNREIQQEIVNVFKIQPGSAERPKEAIPVVEVGPKLIANLRYATVLSLNATSATVLAANPTQDVYLWGYSINVIKDATATSTHSGILATVNGAATYFVRVGEFTLTAQNIEMSNFFTHPIKIDRNTAITMDNATNVGNIKVTMTVFYTVDEQA